MNEVEEIATDGKYPNEQALVDEIAAALASHGWTVHREVWCRVTSDADLKPRRRRVDLLVYPPRDSFLRRHFASIVIEAKNAAGPEEIRCAKRQAISAMRAHDWQHGAGSSGQGVPVARPWAALIVTADTWTKGEDVSNTALSMVDRDLWDHGAAILYGPDRWFGPRFTLNSGGFPMGRRWYLFSGPDGWERS